MTTKAYVTPEGVYLMSFDGDVPPPPPMEGAVVFPSAPCDARQIANLETKEWGPVTPSIEDYEAAIQHHVDAAARSKLFRDGVTLASYTTSTNQQWAAEAQAFVAWRDQVWAYAYQELARVTGGERPQPTVAQILSELPLISWPAPPPS